jgi:preprotein translocase subunit YajC
LLEILLQTPAPTPGNTPAPSLVQALVQWAPIIIIVVVFWFLLLNANRKRDKQIKQMRDNLKKGDKVQTVGGALGTVVNVDTDEVTVKVDESTNAKIRFTRSAIHKVMTDEAKK